MANPLDPRNVILGIDIDMMSATMNMHVNDVPILDPVEGIRERSSLWTSIPVTPAFQQGMNSVTITVLPIEAEARLENATTEFRTRFRWWPGEETLLGFEGQPFAIEIMRRTTDTGEAELTAELGGQSHLVISDIVSYIDGNGHPAIRFDVDVDMALPAFIWMGAEPITLTPEVETEIRQEHVKLHAAMMRGVDGFREAFAPQIARLAAAYGASAAEYIDIAIIPLFGSDSGYEVSPFDPLAGEIMLFGQGRLAIIVPSPLTLTHEEWDEEFELLTYLWKDDTGNWQLMH